MRDVKDWNHLIWACFLPVQLILVQKTEWMLFIILLYLKRSTMNFQNAIAWTQLKGTVAGIGHSSSKAFICLLSIRVTFKEIESKKVPSFWIPPNRTCTGIYTLSIPRAYIWGRASSVVSRRLRSLRSLLGLTLWAQRQVFILAMWC